MSSKLSAQVLGNPADFMDGLRHARPTVIKLVDWDAPNAIDDLKAIAPVVVYRHVIDQNYDTISPADFIAGLPLGKLGGKGILWETVNEPVAQTPAQAIELDEWLVEFARQMHERGERVTGPCCATGNPRPEDNLASYYVAGLRAMDVLAFHEYIKPPNDWSQIGRFHLLLDQMPADIRAKPILITETGCDAGGCDECGWNGDIWNLSETEYMTKLEALDAFYMSQPNVWAILTFQAGAGGKWKTFDIRPIWKPFTQYIQAQGGGVPINTPPVPPIVIPPPQPAVGHFTVSWSSGDIQAVYLNGAPIIGTGSQTFEIASDTTITFSVKAKQE